MRINMKLAAMAAIFLITSSSFASERTRISRTVDSGDASCVNIIQETSDFSQWINSGFCEYRINQETAGPVGGTWAQLWASSSAAGQGNLSIPNALIYEEGEYTFSIYAKNNLSGLVGLHSSSTSLSASCMWMYSGGSWIQLGPGNNTSDSGFSDIGSGWIRCWFTLSIPKGSAMIGESVLLSVDAPSGYQAIDASSVYIWGANFTKSSTPCMVMNSGIAMFKHKVLKRGSPNDFWWNYIMGPSGLADDFEFSPEHRALFYLTDTQMDCDRAWGITTSSNIGIAMGDQEINVNHYDLKDNVWHNPGEIPDNGIDDDGNGMIDDYSGWDFRDWNNHTDIRLNEGGFSHLQHGTQMMSLMCARGNNDGYKLSEYNFTDKRRGTVGVLWDARILPGLVFANRVADRQYDTSVSSFYDSSYCKYLANYAHSFNADFRIIGESLTDFSLDGVSVAESYNMLLVSGAGNSNSLSLIGPGYEHLGNAFSSNNSMSVSYVTSDLGTNHGLNEGATTGDHVWVCGYAGREGSYYNFLTHKWNYPPGAYYPAFVAGYAQKYVVTGQPSLLWDKNFYATGDDGLLFGIIPTPQYTSGASAEASGLAAMVWGLYNDLDPGEVKAMIARGAITDVYLNANNRIDGCGGVPCMGTLAPNGEYGTGYLGYGRMSAYRSITLWGTARDTTLTGDVYVSGDVNFSGSVTLDNVTFHVAPYDIYENEIDISGGSLTCQPRYKIDYTAIGSPAHSASEIEFFVSGFLFISNTSSATFLSNAEVPGEEDWGGISATGTGFIVNLGTLNVSNTTKGVLQ